MIDDWIGDYTNQFLGGISDSANGEPRSQPGCLETEMTVDGCRSHCSVGVWWDDCSHRETYHGTYLKHGKKNIGIWQNMEFLLVFVIVNEKCHGNHVRRMPGLLLGWGKRFSIEGIAMELSSHIATENPSFIGDCFCKYVHLVPIYISIYRRSILTGMVMVIFWLIQILMVISWEFHRNIVVVFHRLSSRSYPQNACLQELEQTPLSYTSYI